MKNFTQSLLDLWKQLGLNQRVSLTVAALAVVAGLVAVVLWSRRPDYQLLYARLSEKDAASIIGQLQTQNIPHVVTAGGTAQLGTGAARIVSLKFYTQLGSVRGDQRQNGVGRQRSAADLIVPVHPAQ